MPSIKEIADACGVTKPTVTAKLKEIGMWDGHVNKKGKSFVVSAEAASAVSAALKPSVSTVAEEPAKQAARDAVYEAYIADLKATNDKLWEQVREKDALIAELTQKLADNQPKPSIWDRLLPGRRG